jgi:hypothetical protein
MDVGFIFRKPTYSSCSGRERQLPQVDYRDRISVVTWMVVLGLGVSLMVSFPTVILGLEALGSPVSLAFGDTAVMALFLALLTASGTEGVLRAHPHFRRRSGTRKDQQRTWAYWALPAAVVVLATFLLPFAPTRLLQVIGLLIAGTLLAITLFSLYSTVESDRPGFRSARVFLNVLAYGSALVLFLLVYQTRTRSLVSGTLVAATAILLAVEILRSTTHQVNLILMYATIVGLVLGEVTWAMNYWLLPGLTGGMLLLLIFYLLVGLAQQSLQDRLNRRVVAEFALFALLALVLIAVVGPGFAG